jgi:aminoglycoside phosphotransferase (APT) family kinase protein
MVVRTAVATHVQTEFDANRLNVFLQSKISGLDGPMLLERISGGQSNPTYFVTYGSRRLVLRKQPPGPLLPSAHAIDREYRVMHALKGTGVPVPVVLFYSNDMRIIGTPFYVMERLEGKVFHDGALPGPPPEQRRPMYHALAETLAKLHNNEPSAVGLADYGKTGNYFARQIARWTRQWELSQTRDDHNIQQLIEWLPAHVPADDMTTIVHGDYRIGNVMFHMNEPNIVGVLDWELSTLGHPLADLAHSCMTWHSMHNEYGGLMDLNLHELRLPSQTEYEEVYYEAVRHDLRMTSFHMAFALFRFAVIFEGIAARAKAGNASDARAAQTGLLAANFAQRAIEVLNRS